MVSRSAAGLGACGLVVATLFGAPTRAEQPAEPPVASPPPTSQDAPPDPAVEQAREAFTLGTTLAGQGEWPEALRAFERSSKLHPHPVTTYNVAYCERALGHYTRAYKLFLQSLSEHESKTTGTLPDDQLSLAKSYSAEVEHRLARVLVRVAAPGASLSVDGSPLEVASAPNAARVLLMAGTRDDRGNEAPPASSFELLIDPGHHLFVLSRPGASDSVVSQVFETGASRELVLGTEPVQAPPTAPTEAVTVHPSSSKRTWAYVSYGVGGAGLVTGSIFGILAIAKKSYLDDGRCPNKQCYPGFQGDLDAMNRDATIATVGFVVAGAGAAIGTYLLLTSNPESSTSEKRSASRLVIDPVVGPGLIGARGRF